MIQPLPSDHAERILLAQLPPLTIEPDAVDPAAVNDVPREIALHYDVAPIAKNLDKEELVVGVPSETRAGSLPDDIITRLRTRSKMNTITVRGLTLASVQRIVEHHYAASTATGHDVPVAYQAKFIDHVGHGIERSADDVVFDHIANHGSVSIHTDSHGVELERIDPDELQHLIRAGLHLAEIQGADNLTIPHRGRHTFKHGDRNVELRLVSVPTRQSHCSLSVRIVPDNRRFSKLDAVGMPERIYTRYMDAICGFNKLVAAVGPPSHGKSTLMRASLYEYYLLTRTPYIRSIEWPVEAVVDWMVQTSIEPGSAKIEEVIENFKSIPVHGVFLSDILNLYLAEQSLRLAHASIPVFTTWHADSAPQGVSALLHEGVNPYTFGEVLGCVVGQRLLGALCKNCTTTVPIDDLRARKWLEAAQMHPRLQKLLKTPILLRPDHQKFRECNSCVGGYLGRTPIFDLIVVNEHVKRAIYNRKSADEIAAADPQYEPLWVAAAELVLTGKTSPEEALRWVKPPHREVVA